MIKNESAYRFVLVWLGFMIFLLIFMISLGGVTRLTDSGLSMVDWKPIFGWLPPLTFDQWTVEFNNYKKFPEFQLINYDITISDFKYIFFFEYAHRLLGRIIGLAAALPFFYLIIRKWIEPYFRNRVWLFLILIGVQGILGWWMVKSGLVENPHVSHYRLASHLGLALIILSLIWWDWLSVYKQVPGVGSARDGSLLNIGLVVYGCVFVQIILGAFVSGLDAGSVYNTWPLMDGQLVPNHYWLYEPKWRAPFEHITAVQFNHRTFAFVVSGVILTVFIRHLRQKKDLFWPTILCITVLVQVILGIVTLLWFNVILLGAFHQAVAVVILLSAVGYWHQVTHKSFNEHKGAGAS